MTRAVLRTAIAWLALGCATPAARAQAGEVAPDPPAGADPSGGRALVLFLLTDREEAVRSELRDALLAQFALLEAELAFERASDDGAELAPRMADAQQRAKRRGALAVFWIDAQSDQRWFVHMMDSERERIVIRPVDAGLDRRAAAIEAIAVMTRESTRALLEGAPIEEPPRPAAPPLAKTASPPPPPQPAPAAAPEPAPHMRALRLAAGYAGSDVAERLTIRHGITLSLDWLGFAPLYVGASYLFTQRVTVNAAVAFDLQPLPVSARAGYRMGFGALAVDLEFGVLLEVLRSSPRSVDRATGIEPKPSRTVTLFALAPRLRAEFAPWPELGLFAAVGSDILMNKFSYVIDDDRFDPPQRHLLLSGRDLRPVLELGVAFYP